MKKIFYKILQKIINFKDKKKKFFFNDFCEEINFLDIGAAEGLDARWDLLKERINFFFVEPHPESSKDLSAEKKNIITKVFDEKPGLLKEFFLTNKPTCSSFLKPNISYLNKFEDANRYNINKILKLSIYLKNQILNRLLKFLFYLTFKSKKEIIKKKVKLLHIRPRLENKILNRIQ